VQHEVSRLPKSVNAIPNTQAMIGLCVANRLALFSLIVGSISLSMSMAGCGIQSQPRSELSSPQAGIRYIRLRDEPANGTETKRTLPRAVAPTGAADRGLGKACVVLLVESPSFRYSDEKIVCEELSPPPEIQNQGNTSQGTGDATANLTADQADLFKPAGVIISVSNPSQLNDASIQNLSPSAQ
jgi:hypothetical protein